MRFASFFLAAALMGGCGDDDMSFDASIDAGDPTDGQIDVFVAQCENGRDDDGDGYIDFPDEPECDDRSDDDEAN